ncbi:MAG: bacterioferritin [Burkholderiaceae bacterium]|nr:bacterioferritin [Burkholderiaceae bacterium]
MKTDRKIITALNTVLKSQLTGINQYFLHARMFANWGLQGLNEANYKISIKLMKQSDKVIERILFLEGLPNLQSLGNLQIGENVPEAIKGDLQYELTSQHTCIDEAIKVCNGLHDFASEELLRDLMKSCEDNIDELETRLSLIQSMGLANYLQTQVEND